MTDGWLSLDEAATYLNIGKTALYTLAREDRVPARKIGNKWIFDRGGSGCLGPQRDRWRPSSCTWNPTSTTTRSCSDPQRDGYIRTYEFFRAGKNKAILQLPVGCGKTGLAALLPLGLAKAALVIAPNLTIKTGLFEGNGHYDRQKCFWRRARVLGNDQDGLRPTSLHVGDG